MRRKYEMGFLGHQNPVFYRDAGLCDIFAFAAECYRVQDYAVPDDIDCIFPEYSGGYGPQYKAVSFEMK